MNERADIELGTSSVAQKYMLLDVLVHLLRRAHFNCESQFPEVFSDYDITSRQLALLLVIGQRPNSSQKAIGEMVALDVNTVSDTLRRMERKGLVRRAASLTDARSICVSLTSKGFQLLEGADEDLQRLERRVVSNLDAGEEQQLKDLLRKMMNISL
ncbi:MarR family winged helix-turn-helix transcriptional regulator [Pseudooceanicola antarcticus]|uniref:MarR family winged helix-turn-helix transcriptional regulator n=1 Tax=Pseudooceanicola antarcticus TaxID=1247613 RepID=UPI0012FE6D71|nr:MarR family transcriptional regulator [Pseudooceanicola antarcticus]